MQKIERQLDAGSLGLRAEIYLPDGASIQEDQGNLCIRSELPNGVGLLEMHGGDRMQVFLGLLQGLDGADARGDVADEILAALKADPRASMDRLSDIACQGHQALKCLVLELDSGQQEDPDDYYLARVHAAGMPPLLLIDAGNYRIPTRSGIPLGISPDLEQPSQSLEWDRGGILHLHTEPVSNIDMETLHQGFIEFDPAASNAEGLHIRLYA
ncbi:MAG: SpoIIE family protein phosphatase [Leptospiraceae bacterium]|nr:SpoIIE family protein phosphatase [Leptospiraceae bacterium]MCB1302638.1 SpoIIE family protein phosphatase [Leptospiraceae bacterium]